MGMITHFLLLCSLSVVVTAQDCGKPELEEGMVLKGVAILEEIFQEGSSVSLGCVSGYQSSGPSSLTCRGGRWSTLRMTCKKRNCGSAGEVVNGDIEYPEGTEFGAGLEVRCNPGSTQVGGSRVIRCDVQGWTGRLPECEAVVCEDAPLVENANVSPVRDFYQYGDSIEYTCLSDYTLIGPASLTCSDNATFTPNPPECRPVVCEDAPPVENANVSPVRDSYQYGDSIEYTCLSDYTLIGPASLTCSDDGTFTPNPPECRRVQCDEPDIKNGRWDGGARPPYKYLYTVMYRCNDGYKMEGEGTITCEKDNNWSPRLPTCKAVVRKDVPPVENANVSPVRDF